MRAYCRKEQFSAIYVLKSRNPYSIGLDLKVFQNIRSKCRAKWQPDYEMRDYCEKREIKEYQELYK